jgi:transposase
VAERNRLLLADAAIQKSLKKHVRWLEKELGSVEEEVAKAVEASPVWRAKEDLLRSVPGVGRVLATTLLADLPELGHLNTHNPTVGGFYRGLVANGKPKKVALVAAMRKLLVMLNAMARDGERWDPDIVPVAP